MSRVSTIEYEGVSIILIDWTELNLEGISELMEEARAIIHSSPPLSVLALSDFTDTRYDKATTDMLAEYAASNKPYMKASALVGITGMKKILYNVAKRISGRNFSLHETREEAIRWLASQ